VVEESVVLVVIEEQHRRVEHARVGGERLQDHAYAEATEAVFPHEELEMLSKRISRNK
jgi:hypothetical protein